MYFFYYIPVGINARLSRFPIMTVVYTVICMIVFILARYLGRSLGLDFYNIVYVPAYSGVVVAVAAGFLHFGWLHLVGNLVYLTLFGRYVEDRMGSVMFTLLFLSSAGIGNWAQGLFNMRVLDDPYIGIIGASGAVSGMMGAFTVRFIRSKMEVAYWVFMPLQAFTRAGRSRLPAVLAIAFWFLLQACRGLLSTGGFDTHVAHVTHLSGFIWGMAFAFATGQWREGRIEHMQRQGDEYARKGQPYAAQGAYIRYLTHRPEAAGVHAALARAMAMSGNEASAQKHYRKACELMLSQGDRGDAENLFQEAVRGYTDFALRADLHLNLAFGLERNLKSRLAVKAYENFRDVYPQHAEAPFTLLRAAAIYWHALDKPGAADFCYRKLVEDYPQDPWIDFAKEQIRLLSFTIQPLSE